MSRIVYLSESIVPSRTANSVHVMKMCQAMAQNGHEITLLAPDIQDPDFRDCDSFEFYGVDPVFEIVRGNWPNRKGRAYFYAWHAARLTKRIDPDLVLGRFLTGCLLTCWFGLPTVYESHTLVDRLGRFQKILFKRLIRSPKTKRLVVISEALKNDYFAGYPQLEGRILVAHDCADNPPETPPMPFADTDRMQVGYLGHLYAGRGIEIILAMSKACPWADFHFVGGMENDVAHWKRQTEHIPNVFFHGFVSPKDTVRYRQSCDVLLAPYQQKVSVHGGGDTSRWMSPLKIFEYMAAGKAILCSDMPVLREVLQPDHNAILCTPDNPDEWIEALQRLKENPDIRERLGQNAWNDFWQNYTWKQRAQNVLEGIL